MSGDFVQAQTVGINDMAIALPSYSLLLKDLIEVRIAQDPSLKTLWEKALLKVGQKGFCFPGFDEDSVTLALQAVAHLHESVGKEDPYWTGRVQHIIGATETGVDCAKSITDYMLSILQNPSHTPFCWENRRLGSFQIQKACAAGVLGVLMALPLVQAQKDKMILILASDVARYTPKTTAELTQGGGAAAILVSAQPRLLTWNPIYGLDSQDVADFFRPIGHEYPIVNGVLSIKAYLQAIEQAFEHFSEQINRSPQQILLESDRFVFHVPYVQLAQQALQYLLKKYLDFNDQHVQQFFQDKHFLSSLEPLKYLGNSYTASFFFHLYCTLEQLKDKALDEKRISFLGFSYGSGNTASVIQMFSTPQTKECIQNFKPLRELLPAEKIQAYWDGLEGKQNWNGHGSYCFCGYQDNGYRHYGQR